MLFLDSLYLSQISENVIILDVFKEISIYNGQFYELKLWRHLSKFNLKK